ncbi:protein phosphatase 2C domain-containing protein [Chryseobacterium sp. RP-3-3]|uniref:Protein phosphatase 2C domain-containing protein n=1 Tax=Chryseobacterium antibioticum TaxID=2728847 RepID=A0A7Y0ALX6_9FLAO|nr:protein phosphatase 2C domain-containing protein [Chryseobacterium antibioticum]NML69744.1 protein phosphatase 2C domain-containing protein [Chryseobacterium antibioticum]
MNIYSALQMGDYHTHHCEDDLLIKKIGSDQLICAIMDGCSTAMDSHFASTLIGKLLRKTAIEKGYKDLYENSGTKSLDEELKEIVRNLFKELVFVKNRLMLDEKELLSTLVILLYNSKENKGVVLSIGDGVISINGKITEFDRDNKPDYLAYHLHEDFEEWYAHQHQKIFFDHLSDISIATDGILTFTKIKKTDNEEQINIVEYLMTDQSYHDTEEMLNRKLKKLEHHYGLKPTDDLAMIRIIREH